MDHSHGALSGTAPGGWSEERAAAWVRQQDRHDRMLAPYGGHLLGAAELRPGDVVMDVGCGTGQTTVDAARAVTPSGRVVGIDSSATMLEAARRRVDGAGVDNVHFVHADAEVHRFRRGKARVAISRFGTHNFVDPSAAFANLRTALAPGGRFCFTAWAEEAANGWSAIPERVLAASGAGSLYQEHRAGPFALADPDRTRAALVGAGYTDVRVERVAEAVWVAADVADAIEFFLARATAALADTDETARAAIGAELATALEPFHGAEGVRLPSAAWIVSGTNG
jgi:SAM-dependent methyltransferase